MNAPSKLDIAPIVTEIRLFNQEGKDWTMEVAERLGRRHGFPVETIYNWGVKIYEKYSSEHGAKFGSIIQKIEFFLNDHYIFRRNVISGDLYWTEVHNRDWRICKYNDVWRFLQHNLRALNDKKASKVNIGDVTNLLESSYVREYNPFKEYFETLPEWDEVDHITALAEHIQCEDQEFWLSMFKKTLVRMIACSYAYYENRIITVLVQEEQEQGKDTFIRFLCPPELHEYYKEDPLEINKDSEIALTKNFIWNLTELDHLNRKEISEIKAIISRKVIKQRAAFARQAETRPRVVNWWGSTNKIEFLTDDRNTRWLCFIVKSISWAYSTTIDIQKVWAQAWHLYKTGFNWSLDATERVVRDTKNKEFEVMPDEKQLILSNLSKTALGEGEFLMPTEIQMYLLAVTGNKIRLTTYNITKSMTQLGFVKDQRTIGTAKVRGFWARKKPVANPPAPSNGQTQLPISPEEPLEAPF